MNENLFTSNEGLRLITQFEGAPRLKARLCEGGRYELSYGVTFHLDGRPVEAEETCTEDYAMALFRNALGQFEEIVKRHVTIELTQYQFDALTAFSYNVGEANFASSTVLRETNARRFEDAAASFSMWIFATRDGWKQAYRGLLRRRLAEATLYLGYDWVQATEDDAIALQKLPPPGDPPKGSDRVTYKTPFLEVLRVAQHYPLPPDTQPAEIAPSAQAATQDSAKPIPATPVARPEVADGAPIPPNPSVAPSATVSKPEPAKPSNSPSGPVSASVEGPAAASAPPPVALPKLDPPKPPPVIAPKSIDVRTIPYGDVKPENGAKNMTDSTRVIGLVIVALGSVVQVLAGREIVSSTIGAVFYDLSRDTAFVAVAAGAIALILGWLTRKRGTHVLTKGMVNATQVLK